VERMQHLKESGIFILRMDVSNDESMIQYHAAKYAVEGLSHCLRLEVNNDIRLKIFKASV
jgi:hypothetical protein